QAFGDFNRDTAAGQSDRFQMRCPVERCVLAVELHRRLVDTDLERLAALASPSPGTMRGLGKYPVADLIDQPGLFSQRYEMRGLDPAEFRMPPTQQRFRFRDRAGTKIDDGLVPDFELTRRQRIAQIADQTQAMMRALLHRRREKTEAVAAGV